MWYSVEVISSVANFRGLARRSPLWRTKAGRSIPVVHLLWEQVERGRFSAARLVENDKSYPDHPATA